MPAPDPKQPAEGFDTFLARLTLEVLTKVIAEIEKLRAKGTSEEDIRKKLDKELRSYDLFTRERIYRKSLGKPIEDDWKAGDVESESSPKENTLVLKVKRIPGGVGEETLVLYKGEDYTVGEVRGPSVTLKKLLPLVRRSK